MVLILNPRVGAIVEISSPLNFLTIVVFPALSSPLHNPRFSINTELNKQSHLCKLSNKIPTELGPSSLSPFALISLISSSNP